MGVSQYLFSNSVLSTSRTMTTCNTSILVRRQTRGLEKTLDMPQQTMSDVCAKVQTTRELKKSDTMENGIVAAIYF